MASESWATTRKMEWRMTPSEGQHQKGTSDALIKSIKRTLCHVIGETVLTFAGLQTVFYEVADVINSRPIGVVTGSDPFQPSPITPNHLLMGRATSEIVTGPFNETKNVNKRLKFIETLVQDWWKRWCESVFPTLVPSYKWHHRNISVGDILQGIYYIL